MNPTNVNTDMQSSVTAEEILRVTQAAQKQSNTGGTQDGVNTYLQQQQEQAQQMGGLQEEQPQPQQVNNSLSISSEIKRLQQLHQLGAPNQAPSNALLVNPGQSTTHDPTTQAFLQHMLDAQQKVTAGPRFESLSSNGTSNDNGINHNNDVMGTTTLPMQLPANFLNDARLLFAQNQLQQQALQLQQQQRLLATNTFSGLPLPSPHSLFYRDGSRRMRGGGEYCFFLFICYCLLEMYLSLSNFLHPSVFFSHSDRTIS